MDLSNVIFLSENSVCVLIAISFRNTKTEVRKKKKKKIPIIISDFFFFNFHLNYNFKSNEAKMNCVHLHFIINLNPLVRQPHKTIGSTVSNEYTKHTPHT